MNNDKLNAWLTTGALAAAALAASAPAGEPPVITSLPITYVVERAESAKSVTVADVTQESRPATVIVEETTNLRVPTIFFRCGADLDFDSDVDSDDLNILLSAFGTTAVGDLDFDGDTDSLDLNLMLATFGDACTPPAQGG